MLWARLEGDAYWACFVAAFLGVAVWESLQPERPLSQPAERRWRNHGALMVIAFACSTLLLRLSPVALAVVVGGSRFGILNRAWPPLAVRFITALVLLDLAQYAAHWTFHHVSFLWRVHQVHHSDADYDVSTGARFHPLEVLCTQGTRLAVVAVLAPPLAAVFASETLAMILNFMVHANASFPAPLEKALRLVLVTPDMHRIHHSEDAVEQQRNLGQTFSWWDRLFGTYTGAPKQVGFRTGLTGFEDSDRLGIGFMLAEPFRGARPGAQAPDPDPLA